MEKQYDVTPLALAESAYNQAVRRIDKMKERDKAAQQISHYLLAIGDHLADALGCTLPEECIFEDAPYPNPLLSSDALSAKPFIEEALVLYSKINREMQKSPDSLPENVRENLEEMREALVATRQGLLGGV